MDRYSLLKLYPALFNRTKLKKSPSSTLYKLLDGSRDGGQGKKVVVVDGVVKREYVVEKYERYKAGLMGRVWLKRNSESADENKVQLVKDQDALGLKWQLI